MELLSYRQLQSLDWRQPWLGRRYQVSLGALESGETKKIECIPSLKWWLSMQWAQVRPELPDQNESFTLPTAGIAAALSA